MTTCLTSTGDIFIFPFSVILLMASGHVCNHKGLMLCVMLPNFNHSLKPALTLSTTLNDLSQDGASNQELSC